MVAASTAPMAHATARSRMRSASTSRRSGSSSLLSLRLRTGRSSERITAPAKTAPNHAPRPTSSTPATAWKPRARSSRSRVAAHRNLSPAGAGRMARPKLFALFQTGGLALQSTQIVQFGAAYAPCADDIDMVHHLGVYREDTLHALAETDLADGDALAHARAIAGNQHAFEGLEALFLAFLDLDVNLDRVAGAKLGEFLLPLVLGNKLGQQRILHDNVRNLLVYNMFRVRGLAVGKTQGCKARCRFTAEAQRRQRGEGILTRRRGESRHVSLLLRQSYDSHSQDQDMARFSRLKVLNTMIDTGLVPVFYHPKLEVAREVAAACLAGGCRLLEFTNRGDHAWEVFNELEKHCARELPEMILGAGSIVDPGTASLYINCGANFVVGPVLNPDVARTCNRRKIPYSPGCGSASEISQAEELGCEIVKVFPGKEVGGPAFVKSVKGPCPWVSIMPTGGVEATEASLKSWFGAGVSCVGMGSNLVSGELLKAGDYAGIAANVRATLDLIRSIRGGK